MNNFKAAIFDLDGTLLDSMWVWSQIDIDYLSSKGHTVPKNLNDEIAHLSFKQTAEYFKNRFLIDDSIETIISTWNSMALDQYKNNVKLKPGAFEYLNSLKSKGIKIALATSNSYKLLEVALKSNNIFNLFDTIVTTDDVSKNKSFPDIYIEASKRLCVDITDCVIFEDAIAAIKGAKLSRAKVIAVQDEYSLHQLDEIKSESDAYILSYLDLI